MREKVIIFSNSRNFATKLSYYSQKTIRKKRRKRKKNMYGIIRIVRKRREREREEDSRGKEKVGSGLEKGG